MTSLLRATTVEHAGMRLQLFPPTRALAPYVTVYYRVEVPGAQPLEDWLPPEWANLRIGEGEVYEAAIGDAPLRQVPRAVVAGPTSKVTRLRIGGGFQSWGIGLLPLGYAKFIGMPACELADRFDDLTHHPALMPLHDVLEELMDASLPVPARVTRLDARLAGMADRPLRGAEAIIATHRALLSGDDPTVAAVAARIGVSSRTLERFCGRYFGFNPQLLLRRQRFLRSLAKYMVDPSMKWISSIDSHYCDQAHFVRDFRRFLGMRPGAYAALPHPIAMTAARARTRALGEAMQVLHVPLDATAPQHQA